MQKIKVAYGYKTLQFDNLYALYTGKIRVKAEWTYVSEKLRHIDGLYFELHKKGCVCISYATPNYEVHKFNMKQINAMLRNIMIDRVNHKYMDWAEVAQNTIDLDTLEF